MRPAVLAVVALALLGLALGQQLEDQGGCGTTEALRAFWAGEKLERPPVGQDTVRSRRFVVHFDTTGGFIIVPQYDAAGDFSGGVADIEVAGRRFLIDRQGEQVAR